MRSGDKPAPDSADFGFVFGLANNWKTYLKKYPHGIYYIIIMRILGFFLCFSYSFFTYAQDISGYWQGVDYSPGSNYSQYWGTSLYIQQTGNTLTGKLYQYAPNDEQVFLEVEVTGTVRNNLFEIKTGRILRDNLKSGYWCLNGVGTLTYNPIEQSLKGTVKYANCSLISNVELYIVKPTIKNRFCKNEKISISVTGQNVKWYDTNKKSKLLGTGNLYEPNIMQTTTFYVSQTHYKTESPLVPITIEIYDPQITDIKIVSSICNLNDGVLNVIASGENPLLYSIDSENYQISNQFTNLKSGNYTVFIKDQGGCKNSKAVVVLPISLTYSFGKSNISACDTITLSAPVNANWNSYVWSLPNGTTVNSNKLLVRQSGRYVITVKNTNYDCEAKDEVNLNIGTTPTIKSDEKVCLSTNSTTIEAGANGNNLTYEWLPSNTSNSNLLVTTAGKYQVKATSPEGCSATRSVEVFSMPILDLGNWGGSI